MPTNEDDPDFVAGFNRDFEELGEEAVLHRLGDFTAGKRAMAVNWLDRKRREAAQAQARAAERAEARAYITIVLSILAVAISILAIIVAFVTRR